MIDDTRTGRLVSPVGDAEAIVDAAMQFKANATIKGCRESIQNCFSLAKQNAAYSQLYQSMLGKTAR